MSPPHPPPAFDFSPEHLIQRTNAYITDSRNLEDQVAAEVNAENVTFENFLIPLRRHAQSWHAELGKYTFMGNHSPVPEQRAASRLKDKLMSKYATESAMRRDMAALAEALWDRWRDGRAVATDEEARKLKKVWDDYQISGAGIEDEATRARYKDLVEQMTALKVAVKKVFGDENPGVWFTKDELHGVPASVLAKMETRQEDGRVKATHGKIQQQYVLKYATSADTRRKMFIGRENRFPDNVARLEELVNLRREIARLVGFKSHAEMKMTEKMARSVDEVVAKLEGLADGLQTALQDDVDVLLTVKKQYLEQHKDVAAVESPEDAGRINTWDYAFYANIFKETKHHVNSELMSEYFELEHTLQGLLGIYEKLFGMRFCRTEASTWHESVSVYTAWDSEAHGGAFLGYFYTDLYARDGKYSGAHVSLIQQSFQDGESRRHAAVALVCSFASSSGQPCLLQHAELKTLFHELGHAIHRLVVHTDYTHIIARDFIEIPSVLLEHWIWVPEILQALGRHYSYLEPQWSAQWSKDHQADPECPRPPETMDRKLAEDLARTKNMLAAREMLHSVRLALFDLRIHGQEAVDLAAEWSYARKRALPGIHAEDGIGFASFAHVFNGYDAAYFTYALSRVYATDLWKSMFEKAPMDSAMGMRYRAEVLRPGGSRPEMVSMHSFLGRDPNGDAYNTELLQSRSKL